MSISISSLSKLSLTALCAATLVACGGGNDDAPPPVPLSSECAPPAKVATATSNYQVKYADGSAAVRNEVLVINEPVELNGQQVVRNRAAGRSTFNAPATMYGAMLYDNQEEYFLWNTGGSRSYFSDVIAEKWDNIVDRVPDRRVMKTYDPAVLNQDYTPLAPGQSYDAPINGKQLVALNDITQEPITILNSSTRHTYVGQEVMGVPAGNLLTCKFSRYPGDGSVTHEWVQHGTGMLVRRMSVDAKGVILADEQLINSTGFR